MPMPPLSYHFHFFPPKGAHVENNYLHGLRSYRQVCNMSAVIKDRLNSLLYSEHSKHKELPYTRILFISQLCCFTSTDWCGEVGVVGWHSKQSDCYVDITF